MSIERIGRELTSALPAKAAAAASGTPIDFGSALKDVLGALESSNSESNQAVGKMLEGTGDVHDAMIAMQRADMMLQLTVQIRNKVVAAYQDVMRMPV